MNILRKLPCFRRPSAQEIAQPYQDTLPPPRSVLTPPKTPARFPTSTSHETSPAEQSTPESSRPTRIASQAPQIPPDLFTCPTVRVVSSSPTAELEGDSPPLTGKDVPKSPSSWLTTGSEESATLGAEQDRRTPGGDLRTLPSVRVTMHDGEQYHAR